jgi:uncharacterized membrane protein
MFANYYHMMDGGQYWNDGMMFVSLLWIALAVFVIVYILKSRDKNQDSTTPTPPKDTPLDIAKTRYVKGEIDKEQFEQIKADLAHR